MVRNVVVSVLCVGECGCVVERVVVFWRMW